MTCLSCNGNHPYRNIFLKYKFIYTIRNNGEFWSFFLLNILRLIFVVISITNDFYLNTGN